jgi:hypothetical protein
MQVDGYPSSRPTPAAFVHEQGKSSQLVQEMLKGQRITVQASTNVVCPVLPMTEQLCRAVPEGGPGQQGR